MQYNPLVVFDCDGTLVDSQHSIVSVMEDVFKSSDLLVPSPVAIRSIIGLSLEEAIESLLSMSEQEGNVGSMAQSYKDKFFALRKTHQETMHPLYEGIDEALSALEQQQVCMSVATGNSQRGMRAISDYFGWQKTFITLATADIYAGKPHPEMLLACIAEAGSHPKQTIMVGDTSYDMQMARSAGVYALAVGWGYHDRETLMAAGAHAYIEDPRELQGFLEAILREKKAKAS